MKTYKYLTLFVLTIALCSTLVACSGNESVYNENITESPSIETVIEYNYKLGGIQSDLRKIREATFPTE